MYRIQDTQTGLGVHEDRVHFTADITMLGNEHDDDSLENNNKKTHHHCVFVSAHVADELAKCITSRESCIRVELKAYGYVRAIYEDGQCISDNSFDRFVKPPPESASESIKRAYRLQKEKWDSLVIPIPDDDDRVPLLNKNSERYKK